MECYISEAEAKKALEDIAKAFTSNFLIYVRKRATKSPIRKAVTYAVVFVYDESNEEIYNAFLKYDVEENKETKILQSETFLENTTKKEVFFVECLVGI
ncbi:MAG: hypothetical protein ACEQSQ_00180 [Candidatus Paceibacteria bacterium]